MIFRCYDCGNITFIHSSKEIDRECLSCGRIPQQIPVWVVEQIVERWDEKYGDIEMAKEIIELENMLTIIREMKK